MQHSRTDEILMHVPRMNACLNRWFARYEQARGSLDAEGGYLFPYKNQFFITEEAAVEMLGLDPKDPDWELIGKDWVRPANREAWERLRKRRMLHSHLA